MESWHRRTETRHQAIYQDYDQPLTRCGSTPECSYSSSMPLTLLPGFSPSPFLQKSGSEYFWRRTKVPGDCKSFGLGTGLQSLQSFQLRGHDAISLKREKEVYLPPELWDMILDEVKCTLTVTGLCRVSHDLYHVATPKLYKKIGILYKCSSDVRVVSFNEAFTNDTTSLEKNSTPFMSAHWHHLRHVRSLIIVDVTQDSMHKCTDSAPRRCGIGLDSNCQQINDAFFKLGQILRKMAFPKSIRWQRRNAWVKLPEKVLETIGQKFGDSLSRLQLDISNPVDGRELGRKIETAIGRMACLQELELTGVAQNETVEAIGNYLRSPAGKSVRVLRLEGVLGPFPQIKGLRGLQGFDTGNPETTNKLEIESLHLRHFYPDEADKKRSLSMVVNPKTLTSITLIDCGSLVKQLKGTSTFPNLKRLYLGGAYQHIPRVFDELPVLEDLITSVNARIEQQFYGGITRYLRQKGHGLRRLGVLFTQREGYSAADRRRLSSYKLSEQAFMQKIRDYCKNLEELGVWHTDIFFAESIIIRLPKLRAVSLNNNSAEHIAYPPPYPTGLSGILYLFQQSDIEAASTLAKPRSQLTFIKQNDEAWRRLELRAVSRPRDHVMPTMTIRKLSRRDEDIPRIFLVEDSHNQQCHLWGTKQASEQSLRRP